RWNLDGSSGVADFVSQLRVYRSFVASRAIGAGPNTSTGLPPLVMQSTGAPPLGSPVRVQTSTTGERAGLNVPAWKRALWSGARGGKKKKKWLPECAPSEIRYAGPWLAGGCRIRWSLHPTVRTAIAVITSAKRCIGRLLCALSKGQQPRLTRVKNRPCGCPTQPVSRFAPLEASTTRTTARLGVHSI